MNFLDGMPTIPKSRTILWKSSLEHEKSSHDRVISTHHFNHSLHVLIPTQDSKKVDQFSKIINKMSLEHFFYTTKTCLVDIVMVTLEMLQNGCQVYSMSVNSHVDQSNCFAILPSGTFILSLDKDTYEQLGLQGTQGKFNEKYRVTIPIDSLTPEKPLYKRLISALEKTNPVCALFAAYKNNKCMEVKQKWNKIPGFGDEETVKFTSASFDRKQSDVEQNLLHFIGSCLSNCKCPNSKPTKDEFPWSLFKFNGFVPPHICRQILQEIANLKVQEGWSCMTVGGFQDSIVSWAQEEHGFDLSGENDYSYVVFPDQSYWLYEILGQNDQHS